jgi:hypothetical protein
MTMNCGLSVSGVRRASRAAATARSRSPMNVWASATSSDAHKRLMLFASLQILGPAGARTPATFAALGISPIGTPFFLFILLIVAGPIAYDLLARGRLHRVTVACLPIHLGSVAVSYLTAGNESVRAFILGSA